MNGLMISAVLSLSFFASAQDSFQSSFVSNIKSVQATTVKPSVFSSNWEAAQSWNKAVDNNSKTILFSHKKQLSQIDEDVINKGLVVVFAKGYSFGTAPEKPMSLPFTFFNSDEVMTEGMNWYSQVSSGAAQLQIALPLQMEDHFWKHKDGVQFRYFILSPQFFKDKNVSPVQVKSLSYKNFVALLGITD